MIALGSKLRIGALVLSGALFIGLGVSKVMYPNGTSPRLFREMGLESDLVLRLVGGLEVLVGSLILGRLRVTGLLAAMVFIGSTMLLVALHSDDPDFLKNCGCMGGVAAESEGSSGSHEPLLLRNSALLLSLFVLLLFVQTSVKRTTLAAIGSSVLLPLVASVFYLGEVVHHRDTRRLMAFSQLGAKRNEAIGWELPDLMCRYAKDGAVGQHQVRLRSIVGAHDQIIVYSVDCPYCVAETADWKRLSARLSAQGRKLVLVCAPTTPERFVQFQTRYHLEGPDSLLLANRDDLFQLGVTALPAMLQVQEGDIVVSSPGVKKTQPFYSTFKHILDELPDVGAVLYRSLTASIVPALESIEATHHVREPGYLLIHSGRGRSFVVMAGSPTASDAYLELALVLSPEKRIAHVRVLAFHTPHATLLADEDIVRMLMSKTVDEAKVILETMKRTSPMDAHVAQMANSIMSRVEDADHRWSQINR